MVELIARTVSAEINGGAFTVQLHDTSKTKPRNICCHVKVFQIAGGDNLLGPGYDTFQPTGTDYNFDDYDPVVKDNVVIMTGPQGPQGLPGIASLPALSQFIFRLPINGNLFNIQSVTNQVYVSSADGSLIANTNAPPGGGTLQASDFIPVLAGGSVSFSPAIVSTYAPGGYVAFYDSNGLFISSVNAAGETTVAVPNTAAYLRFTLYSPTSSAQMVVNGTTLPTTYEGYSTYAANVIDAKITSAATTAATSASLAATVLSLQTDSARLGLTYINIFNPANVTPGAVRASNGVVDPSIANFAATGKMNCAGAAEIIVNVPTVVLGSSNGNLNYGVCFYDALGNFISSLAGGATGFAAIAVPPTAAQVQFGYTPGANGAPALSQLMVIIGATLPPTYVPFAFEVVNSSTTAAIEQIIESYLPSTRNAFNQARALQNYALPATGSAAGAPTAITGFYVSAPIYCRSGQQFVLSSNPGSGGATYFAVAYYSSEGVLLPSVGLALNNTEGNNYVITVPEGAVSLRISGPMANLGTQMLLAGTTPSGVYVPFVQPPTAASSIPAGSPKLALFGDSYQGNYGQLWVPQLLARLNGTLVYQDGNGGRPWSGVFSQFGGDGTGTTTTCTPVGAWELVGCVVGQTLAQALANCDVCVIALGTNDVENETIGAMGDTYASGSLYGYIDNAITKILGVNPTIRLMMVGPSYTAHGTYAQAVTVDTAMRQECQAYGLPYLSMLYESGINATNLTAMMQPDGIHWSNDAFTNRYAPMVAKFIERYLP